MVFSAIARPFYADEAVSQLNETMTEDQGSWYGKSDKSQ